MAGIGKDTPDPPNGTIDRYPDGTPTGVLKESAQGLVRRLIPPRTAAESEQGLRELAKAFNAEGMTGVKDPGISEGAWNAYRRVKTEGRLTVRVFALWSGGTTEDAAARLIAQRGATTRPNESTGDDHLMSGGVKLFIDGSGGARTAWLHEEWNKNLHDVDTGNRRLPGVGSRDASRDDSAIPRRRHARQRARDRRSRHRLDRRQLRDGPAAHTHARSAARHHPREHSHRSRHRRDGPSCNGPTTRVTPSRRPLFTWWIGDTYAGNFGPARGRASQPVRDVPNEGHSVGERIGLPGHALSGPLRDLVRRGARDAARRHTDARRLARIKVWMCGRRCAR